MMVGFWELDHSQIFESFVTGRNMELGEPEQVDGPGCIDCGHHWMSVHNEVCSARQEESNG